MQLLLEEGFPVDIKAFQNWTPLHYACKKGHLEAVVLLVNNGANVNAKGGIRFMTPLHFSK